MSGWITTALGRGRFEIRRLLSPYPRLFLPLMRRRPAHKGRVIDDSTEIVIEGFPRSGNTFAVAAFEQAQGRPVAIARHLHAAAQVIEGVKRGLPVIVVIRDPLDAVTSQIIRHPELSAGAGLRGYVSFYRPLLTHVGDVVVAPFEQVVSDFGLVVDAVNDRFRTTFTRFAHSPDHVEEVFRVVDLMEQADLTRRHPEPTATVARPTPDREQMKARIRGRLESEELATRLRRAREVHASVLDHWSLPWRDGEPGSVARP